MIFLKKSDRIAPAVLLLLTLQIVVVHVLASNENPPLAPDFDQLPTVVGSWNLFRKDPTDDPTARELSADRLLSESFIEIPGGASASLLVAWFQTQRGGMRQPHSPKVCLPSAGWVARSSDEVSIETAIGAITVNRYIVSKAMERAVVLYWYQTSRRVMTGEWSAKLWVAADALRDRRTDISLVRVIVNANGAEEDGATRIAARFVRQLYPMLKDRLPH